VTVGSAVAGGTAWSKVPLYILAQLVGALLGAVLAWALYYAQFAANSERDKAQPTVGIFATGPELRSPAANLVPEHIATGGPVLPIPNTGSSDWSYAWIPVAGPLIGAVLSGLAYQAAF